MDSKYVGVDKVIVYKIYIQNFVYSNLVIVMSTVVLSVRIKRELKEEAEELGIDIRSVVERALREEILRVKKERFRRLLEKALEGMDISIEEWVKAVKESR